MSGRWWRAYSRARHDPKLLKLTDKHFRWWFNLVCVASENGGTLPPHADLAVEFRVSGKVMTDILDALVASGLLDHTEAGIRPHNWNVLQYVSDSSSNRVKQFRERQRNVSVTPSETETEADTEKTSPPNGGEGAPANGAKHGSRLPSDWKPTTDDRDFASDHGLDPDTTAATFCDYWHAQPGARGRKVDWSATWRNWCRRDSGKPQDRQGVRPVRPAAGNDAFYQRLAGIAARGGG